MRTIHKYPLRIAFEQQVELPADSKIIHVGTDPQDAICLWATVETENKASAITVFIVGTGHSMPSGKVTPIGSVRMDPFMWHVFVANPDKRIL
jgi:hypothetical protein